jgi:hypothetical protein
LRVFVSVAAIKSVSHILHDPPSQHVQRPCVDIRHPDVDCRLRNDLIGVFGYGNAAVEVLMALR